MPQTLKIAVIAGDGIGREVIPAGVGALEAAARGSDVTLAFTDFPWGCEFYKQHGRMMDDDGFERLTQFDADLPRRDRRARRADGVVGGADPRHSPALRSVREPAADAAAAGADLAARQSRRGRHRHGLRARELRGRIRRRRADGFTSARRTRWRSRPASSRGTASSAILRYGFELAATRPRKMLASATKSNALHALDGAVGRGRRDRAEGLSRPSTTASTTSTRWPRG